MNFYEHHLGDYVRDTAHLSMLEDGAYRRLLDAYYIKEVPIPAALRDAFRLARAQSKPERDAVQTVLGEFFEETPEGWRHKRCDAEIVRFQEKRRKAQNSANARWGAQQSQSERNANASQKADANAYADAMRTQCEGNALQSPVPSPQSPIQGEEREAREPDRERDRDEARNRDGPAPSLVTPAAAAIAVMRSVGIAKVNGSDARLLALLARGAGMDHFACAGKEALDRKVRDPFAYALTVVESQMDKAQEMAAAARPNGNGVNGHGPPKRPPSRTEKQAETLAGLTGRTTERTPNADSQPSAIDVESRRID